MLMQTTFSKLAKRLPEDNQVRAQIGQVVDVDHKYGWTQREAAWVFHYQVLNPNKYHEKCQATVLGGKRNADGSYDFDLRIIE